MIKIRSFVLLAILFTLLSCHPNNDKEWASYDIDIIDTLFVPLTTSDLSFGGYLAEEDVFLFADLEDGIELLEVNRDGDLISKWDVGGTGPDKVGSILSAFNYIGQDTICLVSDKGVFFMNRKGENIMSKDHIVSNPWFREKKLKKIASEEEDKLIFVHKSPRNIPPLNHPDHYKNTLNFTIYDPILDTMSLVVPFEEGSRLKNSRIQPADLIRLFAVHDDIFYCLYSPEPQLFVYNIDKELKYSSSIPLFSENFMVSESNKDIMMSLLSSSSYTGIEVSDNFVFLTYRTGIPAKFLKGKSLDPKSIEKLYSKHNQVFGQVLKNGERVSEDILCPPFVHKVVGEIGDGKFIFQPNGNIEFPDREAFFIGELVY